MGQGTRWAARGKRAVLACVATLGAALLIASPGVAAAVEGGPDPAPIAAQDHRYELAAQRSGMTAEEIREAESRGELQVVDGGFLVVIDPGPPTTGVVALEESEAVPGAGPDPAAASEGAAIPGDPVGGSRPGAPVTIFLDFGGERVVDSIWNELAGIDVLDFAPALHRDPELEWLVWASVAEDFAPFDVNVTTAEPAPGDLVKSSDDDARYGSHIVITASGEDVYPDARDKGGIAMLGGTGSLYQSPAYVFGNAYEADTPPAEWVKTVAERAAHEAGHNFGLSHDGYADQEYYWPCCGIWAPTMGAAYTVPLSQWSNGEYANASNTEDDLAVITNRSAALRFFLWSTLPNGSRYAGTLCPLGDAEEMNPQPGDSFLSVGPGGECDGTGAPLTLRFEYLDRAELRADDFPDAPGGPGPGEPAAPSRAAGSFSVAGVISTSADRDAHTFTTAGGRLSARVDAASIAPNLDTRLTLSDATGRVLASDAPETTREGAEAVGLGASVSATLPAGTYTLTVEGVGQGDPGTVESWLANAYASSGSLGNYLLSGTIEESGPPPDPDPASAPAPRPPAAHNVTQLARTGADAVSLPLPPLLPLLAAAAGAALAALGALAAARGELRRARSSRP